MRTIRVATRKSELALAQSTLVGKQLSAAHGALAVELVHIVTTGDRKQGTAEAAVSDKRDWVLEIEHAVLRGEAEFAVHSGKDVPIDIEPGTSIAPVLQREFPFDALLVSPKLRELGKVTLEALPKGARVGTASLRRQAHLRRMRPDLELHPLRGNVTTRLKRLIEEQSYDAIVLASAGLERLGLGEHVSSLIPAEQLLPAVSQGTLVVQWRTDDAKTAALLAPLTEPLTVPTFLAERELISILGADCKSAVSSYAQVSEGGITITGRVLSLDGSQCLEAAASGHVDQALELARSAGQLLINQGAAALLADPGLPG